MNSSDYILALNSHPRIGSQSIKKVLAAFGDDLGTIGDLKKEEISIKVGNKLAELAVEAFSNFNLEKELSILSKLNIGYVTFLDKNYPALLKELPDAPAILYVKGDIGVLDKPGIAIVGSRKYTQYGKAVAYKLSRECAFSGLAIISGLALGIDAVAHRAALDANGITVGVLGCGLDCIYPVSNFELGREIIEKGGAVISEFHPGTPPSKFNFPQRNRIIAGLSLGTLVVEAAEKSGALITAFQAIDYNREVFAVPGNIDSMMSAGTNCLIKQGAKLVSRFEDILEELDVKTKISQKNIMSHHPLTDDEKIILNILEMGEHLVDEIVFESKLNIISVNSALSMMEMKGLIENQGGGRFKKRM